MHNTFIVFIFSIFLSTHLPGKLFAQDQWDDTFIGNNEGILQIKGTEQNYEFRSNNISARINRDQNRMEFVLPLNSFAPIASDPVHLQIYNDVFAAPLPLKIYITVPFDRETFDTEDFSQPINLILNGVLTLLGESAQLPVEVSFFSAEDKVFYNMAARFNLEQINRAYEGIYREIITGEFGIIVNRASWNEDLDD